MGILRKTHVITWLGFIFAFGTFGQNDTAQVKSPATSETELPATKTTPPDKPLTEPGVVQFDTPTAESIKAAISNLESDATLDPETKQSLLDQYNAASDLLSSAEKDLQSIELHKKLITSAPDRLNTAKDQLTNISSTNTPPLRIPDGIDKDTELPKLRDTLTEETSRIAALKSEQEKINASISELQTRPERVAKLKLDTEAALAAADSAIKSETEQTTSDAVGKARLAVLLTRRIAAQNKLNLLEQQTLSRDGEISVNNVAQELILKRIGRSDKTVAQLKEWIDAKAAAEARASQLAAIQAEKDARLKHPAIQQIAATNTFYATKLKETLSLNTELSKQLSDIEYQLGETQVDFTNMVAQYNAAGLSETLAELLMSEEQVLPKTSDLEKTRGNYKNILTTNALAHVIVNSRLKRLATPDTEASRQLDSVEGLTDAEKENLKPDVLILLDQQKETLGKLRTAYDRMEDYLGSLDRNQHNRIELINSFNDYIDQRLLWTPSVPPMGPADIQHVRDALVNLTNADQWVELGLAFKEVFAQQKFLSWLGVVLTFTILLFHWKLTQFYAKLADQTKKVRTDKFALTIRALIITAFELSPYFLVTRYFGISLQALDGATPFVVGFGFALSRSIELVMPFVLLMGICRPRGLGEEHFKWTKASVVTLRSYSLLYVVIGWVCFFIVAMMFSNKKSADMGGLPRLCYVASALVLSYFIRRLFHPKTGRFWATLSQPPFGMVQRARVVWYPFAFLTPIAFAILALSGYLYTGIRLNVHLNTSLYLLVLVVLGYQLAKRWFLVRQRRATLTYEIEKRRAAAEEAAASAEEPEQPGNEKIEIEDPLVDFVSIKTQTLELMRTLAALTIIIGLWFIWADVIPALNYLDNFQLWQTTLTIEGLPQLVPVTLADLLMVIVVLVTTIVGYRNLPGLLDVVWLQNTKFPPGSRYAIKTLSQYTLFVIGGTVVLTKLGVNWSQLGWMAAALSVGLGFGLQEVVANFICGLLLFVERPIRVGDIVTVADVSGTVVRIQIRATTIMDWERREFIVPNKEFIAGRILNWTLSNSVNRVIIETGVAYGSDTEKACQLMVDAAKEHPLIMEDPPPFAIFEDFASSYLALTLRCYLPDMDNRLGTKHQLRTAIDKKFKEAGIEIPFPQRDLHLRSVDDSISINSNKANDDAK